MSTRRNTGPAPVRSRRIARVVTATGLAVVSGGTLLLTACADGPAAPAAPSQAFAPGPHLSVAPAEIVVETLRPASAASRDVSVSFTVQPGGTTFKTPDGSATVSFPSGFVAKATQFTVTRKAGGVVGYDFQPSGTFTKPVTVTVKLGSTAWSSLGGPALQGAYVEDWSQVDAAAGSAAVNELVPTTVDTKAGTVTMTLSHFSGYLMSTGKKR